MSLVVILVCHNLMLFPEKPFSVSSANLLVVSVICILGFIRYGSCVSITINHTKLFSPDVKLFELLSALNYCMSCLLLAETILLGSMFR